MTTYLHPALSKVGAPSARLNQAAFAAGALTVTVDLGGGNGMTFESPDEIRPYLAAFEQALELACDGQAELARRAAQQAAKDEPRFCTATSPTRYRHGKVKCTLDAGHDGEHEAGGIGPVAYRWAEGSEIDWETEPTAVAR
jgi:hypothetical protein